MKNRFEKITKHVIQKNSPAKGNENDMTPEDDENDMAVETEANAQDQEGKKTKYKNNDLTGRTFR